MKKVFELNIDNPCAEKFEQFEKTAQGGFCQSCQKEVIDFTTMTNQEIIHFFEHYKGSACGQFRSHQLKTYHKAGSPKPLNIWGAISVAFLSFFSTNTSTAQEPKPSIEVTQPDKQPQTTNSEPFTIRGTIKDEYGENLIGATVKIADTTIGTISDVDGSFELQGINIGDIISVSYLTLKEPINIEIKEVNQVIDVTFTPEMCSQLIVGKVGVHKPKRTKRRVWRKRQKQ